MKNRSLQAARWLVLAIFLATLAVSIAGIIRFPAYVPGHLGEFTTSNSWPTEQTQEGLRQLGWSSNSLAWIALARGVVLALPGIVLFALVWRRANTWYLVYVALVFGLLGAGAFGVSASVVGATVPIVAWWNQALSGLSWQFFFVLFYFFPDGRAVPRWTRWVVAAWFLLMAAEIAVPGMSAGNPVLTVVSTALVLCAIGSQIYRYLRRATPREQQQTKWVVYVLAVAVVFAVIATVGLGQFRTPSGPDYGRALLISLINLLLLGLVFQLPPLIIALSILRYRMWDIDVVIRRTLVYTAVTALLALIFFGAVILFQRIFASLSGQNSSAAIVVSTLVIAALFTPLRHQVQSFVDRRFYRGKYDAGRVLAQFGAVARDETDLGELTGALGATLQDTMQPSKLAIWLRGGGQKSGSGS